MNYETGDDVVLAVTVGAAPDAVWKAVVDPTRRRHWWSYLELDPVAGGRFEERWTGPDGQERVTSGSVVEVVPERRLRLSWADDDWSAATEVEISLSAGTGSTEVRVRHRGWDGLAGGPALAEEHRAGWGMHLANLKAHVEG